MRKYLVILVVLVAVAGVFVTVRRNARQDDPTEPASASALAAAAHRHMPKNARLVRVQADEGAPTRRILVILRYDIGGRSVRMEVEPSSELPWLGDYEGCGTPASDDGTCEIRTLDGGTKVAVVYGDPGMNATGVSMKRSDQVVTVWVSPTRNLSDLPVSLDLLTDIATDPLIGLRTSKQMLNLGKDITVESLV